MVSVIDGKPLLLENRGTGRANWLRVRLAGTQSNRMAIGARVKVKAGTLTRYATMRAGESYLSSNDPRLHFGLGSETTADIEVTWLGGQTQLVSGVKANTEIKILQK